MQLPEVLENDLDDLPAVAIKVATSGGDHAAVVKGDQWKQAVQGYLASIAFADEQVGRVIEALDASPHKKDTVIVLWTDHGWHLGEKEHWRKFALWHRSTRTPLMISVPEGIPAMPDGSVKGRQSMQPASLLDIYPTLIELCGLPPKTELSGTSLVPILRNPELKTDRAIVTTNGRNNHAIRDTRWRYIRYSDGSEELYDHDADPNEWTNLADNPEYASTIVRMSKWLPQTNVPDAKKDQNL
jgi:arylsulfatase A-like enzyme